MTTQNPIRVLQVVGPMNRGGIETWLMSVLRTIDRDQFRIDFLSHTAEPCAYDDEIRALGSALIPCADPHKPRIYGPAILRVLREHGPYDVVHSHVHHYSGVVLWLAKRAGIPVRIAHSHLDASGFEAHASLRRRAYLNLMRRLIRHSMTAGLSASGQAAMDLFGSEWTRDPRHRLLFCGINTESFREPVSRTDVRAEFGIPEDAFVIGHVGRFHKQKNHAFLIDIAAEVIKREPNTYFLLIGDGELRMAIEAQIARRGLADRVIFAGSRPDVSRLMLGAMDLFLLPSLYEGLPLVLMEAQAAGLSCIYTDNISAEADIVGPLVHRMALTDPPVMWAEEVLAAKRRGPGIDGAKALTALEYSQFDIRFSRRELERQYEKSQNVY